MLLIFMVSALFSVCQFDFVCVAATVLASTVPSDVNASAVTSAIAALIFAASVASLAFSSCDVKIGICMSTAS